jgi:multiple sugar transport system substrate-binding protein
MREVFAARRWMTRRNLLKHAASSATAIAAGVCRAPFSVAETPPDNCGGADTCRRGQDVVARTQGPAVADRIAVIPGIAKCPPSEDDLRHVGELCLQRSNPGEFANVKLSFLGLKEAGRHNALFRGLLEPWRAWTGAQIEWIDLDQNDYFDRLKKGWQSTTLGFDVFEMGALLEGEFFNAKFRDLDLLLEMPEWVKTQIAYDDYLDHLKSPPVGSWNGKTYRVCLDADCRILAYRTDLLQDTGPPSSWREVDEWSDAIRAKGCDWRTPKDCHEGFLQAGPKWNGFGVYSLFDRALAYAKSQGEANWLFDENMKPQINNPAFIRAIRETAQTLRRAEAWPGQDVLAGQQLGVDPNTLAFQQFLLGVGAMIAWWGEIGFVAQQNSPIGKRISFSRMPGSERVYNFRTKQWQCADSKFGEPECRSATHTENPVLNFATGTANMGWGLYVSKDITITDVAKRALRDKAAWSAAAHLGGKDLSLWTALHPTGFQPYRNSHFQPDWWMRAGYDAKFIADYLPVLRMTLQDPNIAFEPRIPGIYDYYAKAEAQLVLIYAGKKTPEEGANQIAHDWDSQTERLGRERQIACYRTAMGLQP